MISQELSGSEEGESKEEVIPPRLLAPSPPLGQPIPSTSHVTREEFEGKVSLIVLLFNCIYFFFSELSLLFF